MNRRFIQLLSAFTILVGAISLLRPAPLLADQSAACCTSGNGQANCCGYHCSATLTTCESCSGFWNCLFS